MQPKKTTFVPNLTPFSMWGIFFGVVILVIIGLIVVGVPKDFRSDEGFLDTNAALMSDLSLVAYVLLIVPSMVIGYVFARNKKFVPHHQVIMTAVTIFNWALIAFIMAVTFDGLADNRANSAVERDFTSAAIHMAIALTAQALATYLVIRMWFENQLPQWAKVKKIKRYMRVTLAGWLIAAALGVATYIRLYDVPGSGASAPTEIEATPEPTDEAPVATPESTPNLDELEIEDTPEAEDDGSGSSNIESTPESSD